MITLPSTCAPGMSQGLPSIRGALDGMTVGAGGLLTSFSFGCYRNQMTVPDISAVFTTFVPQLALNDLTLI